MKTVDTMSFPELEKTFIEANRTIYASEYFIGDFIEKAVKEVFDIEINYTNIDTQLYSEQEENDSIAHEVEIPNIDDLSALSVSKLVDFAKKVNKFPEEILVKVSNGNLHLIWYSTFWDAPESKGLKK